MIVRDPTLTRIFSIEFKERSDSIQNQLKNLKTDMDQLKVDEKQTALDRIHDENMQRGDTKYQTLQKVSNKYIVGFVIRDYKQRETTLIIARAV